MVNFHIKKVRNPITNKSTNWQDTDTKWSVTINGQKFVYWTGCDITTTPTYDDVLSILLLEASVADLTYEDFCAEFGYNVEEKESERAYQTSQRHAEQLAATGIDITAESIRLADY